MSWSCQYIGTPEGVSKALDEYEETLSDQSKTEFQDAKPHLQGLVSQCVGTNIRLNANGHATFEAGVKKYGYCSVSLGEWRT